MADRGDLPDLPQELRRLRWGRHRGPARRHRAAGLLAELGVDAIWLSPFYPSPQDDNGYDISDYQDVDPTFGTLADFDALVAGAHERGIRVIIDVVVNHTSDEHPWFVASRSAPDDQTVLSLGVTRAEIRMAA